MTEQQLRKEAAELMRDLRNRRGGIGRKRWNASVRVVVDGYMRNLRRFYSIK